MAKNKKKKDKIKPNIFAWWLYVTVSNIFMAFKNHIKIDKKVFRKRNKKEGCLVFYNHATKYDHFLTTKAIGYKRAVYVASSHFYYNKKTRLVLNWVKAISKEQFKVDISAIKKIKKALQAKFPVIIAPEGQMTMHGDNIPIDQSVVKLIKLCNVDIYTIQMHGTYLAYPKWRKYDRKLKLHLEFVKILAKEEINTLPDEQIYQRVVTKMRVDDRLEVDKYHYRLKPKHLIEGLETILYECPKCHSIDQNVTLNNQMTCQNCGNKVLMNEKGVIYGSSPNDVAFANEALWYNWERENFYKKIKNGTLHLEGEFKLLHNPKQDYHLEEVGSGKVVLTNQTFYYEGAINGKNVHKEFKLSRLSQLPFEMRHHFDVPDEDGYFEFLPINDTSFSKIIEFVQAIEVMASMR